MSIISKKGIYGLSAMYILSLNKDDTYIHSKDIAIKANVPHKFLEQILLVLKKEKLLKNIRGNKGGYKLSKNPQQISVYDILNSLESCATCIDIDEQKNILSSFWKQKQSSIKSLFDLSLYDLAQENKQNIIFFI